jgi:hypothetical protein
VKLVLNIRDGDDLCEHDMEPNTQSLRTMYVSVARRVRDTRISNAGLRVFFVVIDSVSSLDTCSPATFKHFSH